MRILTKYFSSELVVKNSRFINEAFPCQSQAEARDILKAQKSKYQDATHVVHAFVIGPSGGILGMSDAGEPPGTAGRPMLDVLKGINCTNILVTVTRYFGGTLLGTGGLVKAYGDSCKSVLNEAEEGGGFEELVLKSEFVFSADYPVYETVKHALKDFHVSDIKEEFAEKITIGGKINADEKAALKECLKNLSSGKILLD